MHAFENVHVCHYHCDFRISSLSCYDQVMMPVRTSRDVPRLALFAKRDIRAMEELTFHYGGGDGSRLRIPDVTHAGDVKCLCGAENCIGTLPFDATLL